MRDKGLVSRLADQLSVRLNARIEQIPLVAATLGDGAGNVHVDGKRHYAKARITGRTGISEVLNMKVPFRDDLPVLVGPSVEHPQIFEVVKIDYARLMELGDFAYVQHHHESHEFQNPEGGDDVTWIQQQQLLPLLIYPTDPPSMTMHAYKGWYQWDGEDHFFEGGTTADLTAQIPADLGSSVYVLVCVEGATEAFGYVVGDEFPTFLPHDDIENLIPPTPDGYVPLAAVCLSGGMTKIEWEQIYDKRMLFSTVGATGSGSAPLDHDHSGGAEGPQLNWDNIWSDAVHDHSVDAEGGQNLRQIQEFELNDAALLTIDAGGSITRTQFYHRIETAGGAATDDLETISGGVEGDLILLRPATTNHDIVVKHNIGNIWLPNETDLTMEDFGDHLLGVCSSSGTWSMIEWMGDISDHAHSAPGDGGDEITPVRVAINQAVADQDGTLVLGETAIPTDINDAGILYTRDIAGETELHYMRGDGTEYQLTPPGAMAAHEHSAPGDGGQNLHQLLEVEFEDAAELTINAGIVTRTQVYHRIDTEDDDPTDDLEWIIGGTQGDILIIRAENSARTVVVKHNAGNILLFAGRDVVLDDATDHLMLIDNGVQWCDTGSGGGALPDHAHSGAGVGGQLDWDSIWSDAVHDHSAAGEGGTLDWDTVWSDAVHDHSAAGEGGDTLNPALVDLNGNADALVLDADGDTSISAPTDDVMDLEVGGADVAGLRAGGFNAPAYAFTAKNTSGAAATANDVGYIDENGEYKTTVTAYLNAAWCVVLVGGANNVDIYVARQGRVAVVLNGNCGAGDYLYTSTTAGQAQPQSYARSELFAVALTANAGGAGGTCSALLLCNTQRMVTTSANDVWYVTAHAATDFVSTINGAPNATTVVYGAVTAGDENVINPVAGTQLGKMVLWNTTRGTGRLIVSTNTATNTITTVNTVDAWANGDAITIQSQTCLSGGSPYFIDIDMSQTTELPETARALVMSAGVYDSGGAGQYFTTHPWVAFVDSKQLLNFTQSVSYIYRQVEIPLVQRRFCIRSSASGAATKVTALRLCGYDMAAP